MTIFSPERMAARARRLAREARQNTAHPIDGQTLQALDDSLSNWTATIQGPLETPYAGGAFILKITAGPSYPWRPPTITCATKIYHLNISGDDGEINLPLLGNQWSPALTIATTVLSIRSILGDPQVDKALSVEMARQYEEDRVGYERMAREWTQRYAMGTVGE